jgi:hypothetical protein
MTKQEIINVIQELPDNMTASQIIEVLRIREQTLEAIASMDAGDEIPQEEIDLMVDEWLAE